LKLTNHIFFEFFLNLKKNRANTWRITQNYLFFAIFGLLLELFTSAIVSNDILIHGNDPILTSSAAEIITTPLNFQVMEKGEKLSLKSSLGNKRDHMMLPIARSSLPNDVRREYPLNAPLFLVICAVLIEYFVWTTTVSAEVMEIWKVLKHRYCVSDDSNPWYCLRMCFVEFEWLNPSQYSKIYWALIFYFGILELKCHGGILIHANYPILTSSVADVITTPSNFLVATKKKEIC